MGCNYSWTESFEYFNLQIIRFSNLCILIQRLSMNGNGNVSYLSMMKIFIYVFCRKYIEKCLPCFNANVWTEKFNDCLRYAYYDAYKRELVFWIFFRLIFCTDNALLTYLTKYTAFLMRFHYFSFVYKYPYCMIYLFLHTWIPLGNNRQSELNLITQTQTQIKFIEINPNSHPNLFKQRTLFNQE